MKKIITYKSKLLEIHSKNLLFLSDKISTTATKRNYKFLKQHISIRKNNFLKTALSSFKIKSIFFDLHKKNELT